jgi:hypothetical protein
MMTYRDSDHEPYAAYRREREARQKAEREAEEAQRKRDATLRAQRLAKLEAERQAQQAAIAAEVDAELEAVRERERHRWFVDHPDRSEADWEKAWQHRKAVLRSDRRELQIQAARVKLDRAYGKVL